MILKHVKEKIYKTQKKPQVKYELEQKCGYSSFIPLFRNFDFNQVENNINIIAKAIGK
jgi:hypothetical protein